MPLFSRLCLPNVTTVTYVVSTSHHCQCWNPNYWYYYFLFFKWILSLAPNHNTRDPSRARKAQRPRGNPCLGGAVPNTTPPTYVTKRCEVTLPSHNGRSVRQGRLPSSWNATSPRTTGQLASTTARIWPGSCQARPLPHSGTRPARLRACAPYR